jgi:hypothetical protein
MFWVSIFLMPNELTFVLKDYSSELLKLKILSESC